MCKALRTHGIGKVMLTSTGILVSFMRLNYCPEHEGRSSHVFDVFYLSNLLGAWFITSGSTKQGV